MSGASQANGDRPPRSGKLTEVNRVTRRNLEATSRMEQSLECGRSFGERAADRFAAIVGSWTFLIIQTALLMAWMALNVIAWRMRWDPYPFILLNLVLSFQAAYAGPIIMMSQNRQARVADLRNKLDLQINLLAEQESTQALRMLRQLCEKASIPIDDQQTRELEQATRPEQLARQIDSGVLNDAKL